MSKLAFNRDISYCDGEINNSKCNDCLRNVRFYDFTDITYIWKISPDGCHAYIKKPSYLKNKIRKLKKLVT